MKRLFLLLLSLAVAAHVGPGGIGSLRAQGDDALGAGIEAYVYAYPLVLMDVTRLYIEKATGTKDNVFFRGHVFSEADSKVLTAPDDNVLVCAAWLDLSQEPVIVRMPDNGRRPLSVQLIDGWTHMFATLDAGTMDDESRAFAVAGPRWTGELPPGMTVIHSPTDTALIRVRLSSGSSVEDITAAYSLQDRMSLTPLSSYGGPDGAPVVQAPPVPTPMKPPSEQVADMDAKAFFTYFADLLRSNPPPAADGDMMAKLASLGIVPGRDFAFDELDPAVRDEISRSVLPARIKIDLPVRRASTRVPIPLTCPGPAPRSAISLRTYLRNSSTRRLPLR